MTPSLVEVTITVPDLDAVVAAWRVGIGLDAAVHASDRIAHIDVQGITIVLVEAPAEGPTGLAGIVLGVDDIEALRARLHDITLASVDGLSLDPSSTSGAPIMLRSS